MGEDAQTVRADIVERELEGARLIEARNAKLAESWTGNVPAYLVEYIINDRERIRVLERRLAVIRGES